VHNLAFTALLFHDLTFSLEQLLSLLAIAVAAGGYAMLVRVVTKRQAQMEAKMEHLENAIYDSELRTQARTAQIEERFVVAIEKVGDKLSEATETIRDILSGFNLRITLLERQNESD
jgi:hypothetical protein